MLNFPSGINKVFFPFIFHFRARAGLKWCYTRTNDNHCIYLTPVVSLYSFKSPQQQKQENSCKNSPFYAVFVHRNFTNQLSLSLRNRSKPSLSDTFESCQLRKQLVRKQLAACQLLKSILTRNVTTLWTSVISDLDQELILSVSERLSEVLKTKI